MATFPSVTAPSDGRLIASYRTGSTKDSDDETVEIRFSFDAGNSWSEPATFDHDRWSGRLTAGGLFHRARQPARLRRTLDRPLHLSRPTPLRPCNAGLPANESGLVGFYRQRPYMVRLADRFRATRHWTRKPHQPAPHAPGWPSGAFHRIQQTLRGRAPLGSICHVVDLPGRRNDLERAPASVRRSVGRVFHWDQRSAVTPDGRAYAFTWMYDSLAAEYLGIRRFVSADCGVTWNFGESLGIRDQPSHPAILPDGRCVLAWVDRFGTKSIGPRRGRPPRRADLSTPESEVVLYESAGGRAGAGSTGETLADMGLWK